ncbi:hypothetical protein K490DRAFT_59175 [Saccharata proteae CBS 121410]|uniref:Uncharacterized protein n=1 Tax=Saccharata proteae CBS 121410 TaxID=1314787 RepID=A0A9P4HNC0_9PEZI|nr:hypothetical protein K490DRAFT_59175 [Saccharata proteae CBS 121410]
MAPLPHLLTTLLRRSIPNSTDIPSHNVATTLSRRDTTSPAVNLGAGAKPASDFNNKGFLALFALIGAGMVIGSIWFFFWAKNGGFHFRGKDDWEDYKSTVLRRKGPDGRTLSNATKSTRLGGGSVVHKGSYGRDAYSAGYTDDSSMVSEKEAAQRAGDGIRGGGARPKRHKKNRDPDVRQYRQEKAARVGGLNRAADGNHFDYSNTEPSELSQAPLLKDDEKGTPDKKQAKKEAERLEKEKKRRAKERQKEAAAAAKRDKDQAKKDAKAAAKAKADKKSKSRTRSASPAKKPQQPQMPETPRRSAPSNAYSFTTGDDYTETATSYTGVYTADFAESTAASGTTRSASYYSSYRPHAAAAGSGNIARPPPAARSYDPPPKSSSPRHQDRDRYSPRASRDSASTPRSSSRQRASHSASPQKRHRDRDHSTTRRDRDRGHRSRSRQHGHGHGHSRAGSATELLSDVTANSETGTKSYPCVIPGLSGRPGVAESVSPFESEGEG